MNNYLSYMVRWTDRQFHFDFPAGMWPVILERLRGTAPRINELVQQTPPDLLKQKKNAAWSIQEHIGHLIDLETLHEGRINDYLNRIEILRAADMTNRATEEAQHNEKSVDELITRFREVRGQFIERLKKLSPELTAIHPRLQQPMRVVDMAYFVAEHDDHHLALMREILQGSN